MPEEDEENSIKIFVRVRPPLKDVDSNPAKCFAVTSNSSISLRCQTNPKHFTFDHVADENTSQETVFGCVGRRTVEACMLGYNGTIFAYGQTGSGKTYTMLGPGDDNCDNFCHELRGVIPRCLEYLFHLIQEQCNLHGDKFESVCKCSFFEIYKEHCYDLLDCASTRPLSLRECSSRGVFVENAKEVRVSAASAAFEVLSEGWKNRRVASTSMNRESSRSHAVFTVAVELKEQAADGVMKVRRSLLNLVDLAGSERQTDAQTSGLRLQEASSINRSLSVLGNVMMALVDAAQTNNKSRHIPYRNSKLTFLLKDSLGGNAKTFIIANVHPNSKFYGESLSTLQFMKRAKLIKNKAIVNEDMQGSIVLLQAEIRKLRQKLSESIQRPSAGLSSNGVDRDKFYAAMDMYQRKCDEIGRFKEMMKRHNNFLLGGKMVNKLRQAEISSLKEALAAKNLLPESDICENMKEQINKLQYQVDNHPVVSQHLKRISELEHEVKRLQALDTVKRQLKLQEEREECLEALYRESSANNNLSSRKPSESECLKQNAILIQRVKTLEDELIKKESLNVELRDTKENLEVELRGKKQQIDEFNLVLEASQTSANMHLKQMNNIHEKTIRTITTPLRRRSNASRGSTPAKVQKMQPVAFAFGDIFETSVENILDTPIPFEMEQAAASEEAEALRHANEEMAQRQQIQTNEIMRLKSEIDTLGRKLELAQQNITKERHQNTEIVKERDDLKNEYEIKRLEARDLKFELKYADNDHNKTKEKLEQVQLQLEKDAGLYHEKYIMLETKYRECETAHDESKQQTLMLENELEVARGENEFIKEQLAQRERDVEDNKNKVDQLIKENLDLSSKLDELMEKQTSEEENLRKILTLESNVNEITNEKMKLTNEIQQMNEDAKMMNQRQQEDKTAINLLMKQVTELRAADSMHEIANEALRVKILEKEEQLETTDNVIRKQLEDMCRHEDKIKQLQGEVQRLEAVHKFELENLQDDLESWSDQYKDLMTSMESKDQQLKKKMEDINVLQEEVKTTKHALEEERINEQKRVEVASSAELEQQLQQISTQRREYESLKTQFDDVIVQYQHSQQRMAQLENVNDALQEKTKLQKEETESLRARNSEKLSEYLNRIAVLQDEVEELKNCCEQTNNIVEKMKNDLTKAHQDEERLNNELETLKHSGESNFENIQNFKSQILQINANNEQLRKENGVLSEECQKLKVESAKLAGHTNHLQKIHYLKRIKEENFKLKMDCTELEEDRSKLEARLRNYEPNFRLRKTKREVCLDTTNQK